MRNIGFFDDTQDSRGIIIKLSKSVRSRFLDRIKHLSLYNNEEVEFITNETSGYDLFFNKPIQQIIYGAPGTGKSFEISKITEQIDELTEANSEEPRVFRTTFHPDSDYSTFVGAYKPEKTKHPVRNVAGNVVIEDGKEVQEDIITYNFCPQAFAKAYIRAWQTKEPVILVIEEINRGNCAQIFGDLFQLLDRDGNNESKYPIDPDTDFGKFIAEKLEGFSVPELIKQGKKLKLPANLYIWATMNTSDQSLFPIDSAFKRRWDWRYIKIAQPKKDGTDEKFNWKIEGDIDWWQFIKKINDIILRMTNSADKQLGYFFAKANNEDVITYDCFVSKVCFYLWNDIFKTYAVDGMENSLFKYTYMDEDDSTEKTGVLDFTKFFDEEGKVVPAIVEQFIQNVMNWQGETK
jgi:5-methylcytosine-specific restriction endonuclease McrBC GTP-binding regulatory subunit McrB